MVDTIVLVPAIIAAVGAVGTVAQTHSLCMEQLVYKTCLEMTFGMFFKTVLIGKQGSLLHREKLLAEGIFLEHYFL